MALHTGEHVLSLKMIFWIQTCQPPKKENLETREKKSEDSTKGSEILFFPYQDLNEPFSIGGIKFYLTLFMAESWELAGLWMNNKKIYWI